MYVNLKTNVFRVTQGLMQSNNIKTMCPNYILELRTTKPHLLQFYLGTQANI